MADDLRLDTEWALERWVEPTLLSFDDWMAHREPTSLQTWTIVIARHAHAALALAAVNGVDWNKVRAPLAQMVVSCLRAESSLNPYEDVPEGRQLHEALATLRLGLDQNVDPPTDADQATQNLLSALDDLEEVALSAEGISAKEEQSLKDLEEAGVGFERIRSAALYELALAGVYLIAAPIEP